jgi:hypothetical protein
MSDKIYLYLEKREFVQTWINGGEIPISLASKYKNVERIGINTPDELTQRDYQGIKKLDDINCLINLDVFDENSESTIIFNIGKIVKSGNVIGTNVKVHQFSEDAGILCFSTKLCSDLAKKLDKNYCVEIQDIDSLCKIIDGQLGDNGVHKACIYTFDEKRNHFLKSSKDEWQQEYRIIWKKVTKETWVKIPDGVAEEIDLTKL